MSEKLPLTDEQVETLLHDVMRQIVEARATRGTQTERGAEALRLAMVGPYGALMALAKEKPE